MRNHLPIELPYVISTAHPVPTTAYCRQPRPLLRRLLLPAKRRSNTCLAKMSASKFRLDFASNSQAIARERALSVHDLFALYKCHFQNPSADNARDEPSMPRPPPSRALTQKVRKNPSI